MSPLSGIGVDHGLIRVKFLFFDQLVIALIAVFIIAEQRLEKAIIS